MKEMQVYLPTPQLVEAFVEALNGLPGDFELIAENYILDARSLMGVFGLDRTKPLQLKIYQDTQKAADALRPFAAPREE